MIQEIIIGTCGFLSTLQRDEQLSSPCPWMLSPSTLLHCPLLPLPSLLRDTLSHTDPSSITTRASSLRHLIHSSLEVGLVPSNITGWRLLAFPHIRGDLTAGKWDIHVKKRGGSWFFQTGFSLNCTVCASSVISNSHRELVAAKQSLLNLSNDHQKHGAVFLGVSAPVVMYAEP